MRWTLAEVACALGVPAPAGLDPVARLAGVSIDSRTVRSGELFVAIHGPRHDGHSFVAAALAAGAAAAVVAHSRLGAYAEPLRGKLLAVDDPLAALQNLARAVRRKWGKRLAGVTGSTGKTTTKEILAALLSARLALSPPGRVAGPGVLKSQGNLNNEYGLPLTLLGLEPEHEAAVVELGMSRRGELARLAQIAEPQVGVVTNVAPVHLEFFSSLDEIALAKRELVEGLAGPDPVAVLNADDPRVANFAEGPGVRVITFGTGAGAMFRAQGIEDRGAEGSAFDVVAPGWRARLELPLVGRHNVMNALAALAAASLWGIGAAEAGPVLRSLRPAAMRGEVLRFEAGFTVINDCYNSNPVALASMIDLLAATPANRRILAAGEMLELGPTSPELHREAGRRAAAKDIDWIFAVQGHAAQIAFGARDAGHAEEKAQFVASSEDAARLLVDFVARGDVLLVKGSRGVKMERIIEALRARYPLAAPAAADVARGPAAKGHN